MPLDDDAAAVIEFMREAMPDALTSLPIEDLRTLIAAAPLPPKLPVHMVYDRVLPGPAGDIPVRVYRPNTEEGLPIVAYLHGGGFAIGTLDLYDHVCREI